MPLFFFNGSEPLFQGIGEEHGSWLALLAFKACGQSFYRSPCVDYSCDLNVENTLTRIVRIYSPGRTFNVSTDYFILFAHDSVVLCVCVFISLGN